MIFGDFEELSEKWRRCSKMVVGDVVECFGGMLLRVKLCVPWASLQLFGCLLVVCQASGSGVGGKDDFEVKTVVGDVVEDVAGCFGGMLWKCERSGLGGLPTARPPARRRKQLYNKTFSGVSITPDRPKVIVVVAAVVVVVV